MRGGDQYLSFSITRERGGRTYGVPPVDDSDKEERREEEDAVNELEGTACVAGLVQEPVERVSIHVQVLTPTERRTSGY